MTEVDTSSYLKPTLPISPLDIAGKLGELQQIPGKLQSQQLGIQRQGLDINQAKLDQANQALQYITRAVSSIGPNGTPDQFKRAAQDAVNSGLVPPDMKHIWDNKVDDYAKTGNMKGFYDEALTAGATHQETFNNYRGQQQLTSDGQNLNLIQTPGSPNIAPSVRARIPIQAPPTTPTIDSNRDSPTYNQPQLLGNQPPLPTPGFTNRLNAAPPNTAPIVPKPVTTVPFGKPDVNMGPVPVTNKNQSQLPQGAIVPSGPITGPSPLFDEGKKQYALDQDLATQKLTAIKPALQALPLIQNLTTGIGTDTYNRALAGLSNLGLLPQGLTDKVAVYQELNKKLAQYVASSPVGQRSDAAQTLAEASSPSPKTQINPALIKLTKDAIVLDRVQALRPGAFEGSDFSKYGQHRSLFPAKVDERAVGLDLMKPNERNSLINDMKKKQNTAEGKKFWDTLKMVDKQGFIDTGGQ